LAVNVWFLPFSASRERELLKAANRVRFAVVFALCLFFTVGWSAEQLPSRLADDAFWKLITEYSEPGGSFVSDNFVSNELAFQDVLPSLTEGRTPGGVYLGVGPEQNFTYVAALKPKIAFVLDIRRQNMLEHLMYKALFELSADRIEFLSRLFSRPRPADISKDAGAVVLFNAFDDIPADDSLFEANLRAVKHQLIDEHGFGLTPEDEASIGYILRAFYLGGPNLTYSGPKPPTRTILPTYEELMTDSDNNGKTHSFIATEENFLAVKQLERDNLIVPIVGDFGGSTAIRSVGRYLKQRNATVTAFYVSNVEQYLFMNESWKSFYGNVATLPLDAKSVFIRPLINIGGGTYTASPLFRTGFHWDTLLFPIQDLITAFEAGMVQNYYDVIQLPN
jgi:hypothetical protein